MTEDPVETLWEQVQEAWDEDKRHQAFIGYCHERGLLGQAARRYRQIADSAEPSSGVAYRSTDDAKRESAKKRLAAITMLAMASIEAQPRADPANVKRWLRIAAVALFFITLAFLGWALLRLQNIRPE